MSLNTSSPSPHQTKSKRSACDRCRGQKLRCPPGSHDTAPCARCSRLGATCSFVYREPTVTWPTSSSDFCQIQHSRTSTKSSFESTTPESEESSLSPVQTMPMLSSSTNDFPTVGMPSFQQAALETFASADWETSFGGDDASMFTPGGFGETVISKAETTDASAFTNFDIPIPMTYATPASLSSEIRLLNLGTSLTRCLEQNHAGHVIPNTNLLADASGYLHEFILILQTLAPSESCLSSIMLITLIATYFRLITLFSNLITNLGNEIYIPSSSSHIAGLSKNLQIKMLLHSVLYQFDTIEKGLGIPVDLRVTGNIEAYPGILSNSEPVRSIFQAIRTDIRRQAGDHQVFEVDGLVSLREGIRQVQIIVGA